jgi:hypothetical protein
LLQLFVVPTTTTIAAANTTAAIGTTEQPQTVNPPSSVVQQEQLPINLESAAPKTGAIWEACEKIGKLPSNNRNAMRRDLLTWMMECQDTMDEFAELLLVPTTATNATTNNAVDMTTWEMFTSGQSDEYTVDEQPIAVASLALIKCSRGSLKVTLNACEAIGNHIVATTSSSTTTTTNDNHNERPGSESHRYLSWISKLHDAARAVGDGMTDLGSLMYPPLELDDLKERVTVQCTAIVDLQNMILEYPQALSSSSFTAAAQHVEFDQELIQLSTAIRTAALGAS